MEQTMLLRFILFVPYLATLESVWRFPSKTESIRKFLDTELPIWTYNTSAGGNARCEVDVMQAINRTSIQFQHLLKEGTEKTNITMMGTFDQRREDRLVVHVRGGTYNISHEIVHFDAKYKCAVIQVITPFSGRRPTYDLRVWNSTIPSIRASTCAGAFSQLEPKGHCIYDDSCQDLLRKSTKSPVSISQRPKRLR